MATEEAKDREIEELHTGNSFVALDEDLPGEYIVDFVGDLLSRTGAEGFMRHLDERDGFEVFPDLGAAILPVPPEHLREYVDVVRPGRVSIGPERLFGMPSDYLAGDDAAEKRLRDPLDAMGVTSTPVSIQGAVTVAIIDTGYTDHPDFMGRDLIADTVVDLGPEDPDGHGTHSTGLACGPLRPSDGSARYGVAHGAKVRPINAQNSRGNMPERALLRAIRHAKRLGAVVAYLSATGPVGIGGRIPVEFERVAARQLRRGLLCVAPAGNDNDLTGMKPVNYPANCPSVMAVGALDASLAPASFSCIGRNPCQNVDIAAPGEVIRSSHNDRTYFVRSGSCPAAAYVTGVAALWADTTCKPRGWQLWVELVAHAERISGAESRVGAGLVQAPR